MNLHDGVIHDMYKTFHSPIASEHIYVSGRIPEKATIFQYLGPQEDGSIYAGPVHIHNNRYVQGSYPSDRTHVHLREKEIGNYKIVDNVKKNFKIG